MNKKSTTIIVKNLDYVNTFSYRLQYAMTLRGMNGAEITDKTERLGHKIGSSAVSQYLSGKYTPKQDKIYVLARVLSVSPLWLMGVTKLDDIRGEDEIENPDEKDIIKKYRFLNTAGREILREILNMLIHTTKYIEDKKL